MVEQVPGKPILAVGIPKVVSKAALKEMKDALNKLKGVLLRVMPKQFTMDDLFGFVDCKQKGLQKLHYPAHILATYRFDPRLSIARYNKQGSIV